MLPFGPPAYVRNVFARFPLHKIYPISLILSRRFGVFAADYLLSGSAKAYPSGGFFAINSLS
jgi:hypothetical protein